MLKSAVLSIGKEIISGSVNDTNSFFICRYLTSLGFDNRYIVSVDDSLQEIVEIIRFLLKKVDIIITTGGLGPTFDDKTMESVAAALNKKIYLDLEALKFIDEFYTRLHKEGKIKEGGINEKRKKMAYLIEGCKPLYNGVGAAWGCYVNHNGKHLFVLPGVPKEMKPMFENEVIPILKRMSEGVTISEVFEFDINDESLLGVFIDKVMKENDVYIKSLPVGFDSKRMSVRFTSSAPTEEEAKKKISEAVAKLRELL